MNIRLTLISFSLLILIFISDSYAAEIKWNLFLKPYIYNGPVLSKTLQAGQKFTIENYTLSGAGSNSSEIMNALKGTTFNLAQSPVTKPIELRVILNTSGNSFEKAGSVLTFLNITFEVFISGRLEDEYRFSPGSPLVMTIPSGSGLNYLLEKGGCKRSDNIIFVFYSGRDFDKEGIETLNQTSGLSARIDHAATVLGGKCGDFGFLPDSQPSTWRKIKELFAK